MKVCNFKYKFKKNDAYLFNELNINFSINDLNIILANNGVGKSILLDTIANVDNLRDKKYFKGFPENKNIAYQMQGVPFIGNISVKKTINLLISIDGNNVKKFDIPDYIKKIYNKKMGDLSGGQRRIVMIYGISILNRSLYLFDEPYSGLDDHAKENANLIIRDLVKKGKKVIITTHDLLNFSDNDNLILLNDGKCIFNGYKNKLISNNKFKNVKEAYNFLT